MTATRSTSSSPTRSRRSGCSRTSVRPCRVLHPRHGYARRRARADPQGPRRAHPGVGPRLSIRSSDGTIEGAGVDVVHFPFQDAFATHVPSLYQPHDLQHLHLPELLQPLALPASRDHLSHTLRAGCGRRDDDLLGPPRFHRELRPPRGEGLGRARGVGAPRVPGAERRGAQGDAHAPRAARVLPALSGAALAPQEPRAAAGSARADPRADRDGDPAGLHRGLRPRLRPGPRSRHRARASSRR